MLQLARGLLAYLARSLRHSRNEALSLCSKISGDMSVVHAGRRGILSLQVSINKLVCCCTNKATQDSISW